MLTRAINLFSSFLKSISYENRDEIIHRWVDYHSQPFRFYHNHNHILDCIEQLVKVRGFVRNNHRFEMALWYHDIFYIPGSSINEIASGDIALNDCKILSLNYGNEVKELIIKGSLKPDKKDYDSLIFHDIDFSILGSDEREYVTYMQNIRLEFLYFDNFKVEREKFLRGLLKKNIYFTEFFKDTYQKKAVENIKRELNKEYV